MNKKIILSVLFLATVAFPLLAQVSNSATEEKIEKILSQLTLDEKVRMCHAQAKFSSLGVPRLGIPEIWMSDGPHGVRAEISWDSWAHAGWTNDSCTAFPALTCLAAGFNPEVAEKYGIAIGEEARFRRKDILLGPGVNIYRTPMNGRNFEYMGEDPYLASQLVVPYITGVQSNGVAACVKHYALNNQEIWRNTIDVELSDRALYEIYLPAFKAAVLEGKVWSMMGGYNLVRGQYCCENELLNNKILKGDWGWDGVLVSDWGAAHSTKGAALNGLDIEMGTGSDGLVYSEDYAYDRYYLAKPFFRMIKNGDIDEAVVNDKARRILRLMFRTNMNSERPLGKLASPDHFQVAREVGQQGIVLLKNKDNFFPINPSLKQTIAVIGENSTRMLTTGGGSSELKVAHEISPLDGITKRFGNASILHSIGYSSGPSVYGVVIPSELNADSLKKAALNIAAKADIVLFVGGLNKSYLQDCEDGERVSYNLPFGQDQLLADILKVNKNVGVILLSGNAIAMPWLAEVKGVMQAWYLGSEAGNAIADIISGDVNPSGKLPFSFPVKLEDNGAVSFGPTSYPGVNNKQIYKEDILVGYRWFDTKKIKPLFEFGYGMSYTTFNILSASSDKTSYSQDGVINILVEIKNEGKVAGSEVIQVYSHDVEASVLRPEKELKAFQKVVLNPGEVKTVSLKIPVSSLAFYDEKIKGWNNEPGKYKILVGNSSRNISKSLDINILK